MLLQSLRQVTRKSYGRLAYELGPLTDLDKIGNEKPMIYRLTQLGAADAEAEKGLVAFTPPPSYTSVEERLKTLEKDNEAFRKEVVINRNQVKELEMRVKRLEITPALLQVCESIKLDEQILIEEHLPLLCSGLGSREIRFSKLKSIVATENDRTGEIADFFEIPIVQKLDRFCESKEYKEIALKRDELAHEALLNPRKLNSKWYEIATFYGFIEPNETKSTLKLGHDIGKIHKTIIDISEDSGNKVYVRRKNSFNHQRKNLEALKKKPDRRK